MLDGQVVVVTGGASGIGAGIARLLTQRGASVVISDVNEKLGESLAAELGAQARFALHDVTSPAAWESVLDDTERAFGALTGLVNNAGVTGPSVTTADLSYDDYQKVVDINQNGTFLGHHHAIPRIIAAGGGSIVNISSAAGFSHVHGSPNAAYTGSKHAIRGLTKAAAVEHGSSGVRVNSVHPGSIRTPLLAAVEENDAVRQAVINNTPLRRIGEPEDIAKVVAFLLSDDAAYVTGTAIPVDGGILAH